MTDLLADVLDAHGGRTRWNEFSRVEATIVTAGKLWALKGQPQDDTPRRMTVALRQQWASVQPFGAPDQKTDFTPDRVAIEKLDGRVVAELGSPRDSFGGHALETPWTSVAARILQRLCAVELSDRAVPDVIAGPRGPRDRPGHRLRRDVAEPAGALPVVHRQS